MNFPISNSNKQSGIYQTKQRSGYSSRQHTSSNANAAPQPTEVKNNAVGLSSRVAIGNQQPQLTGDMHQSQRGSNDYLRLKRVKNDVMNNIISSAAAQNQTSVDQQKFRMNEIPTTDPPVSINIANGGKQSSLNGSGGMSKGSGGATTADSVSNRGGVAFNAERAARHARRLQKASS